MVRALCVAMLLVLTRFLPASAQTETRSIPMLVSAEWLSEQIGQPDLVVVQVDQRSNGYEEGHVPGASFLPYSRIAVEVDGLPVELPTVDDLETAFEEVGAGDGVRVVLYGAALSAARAWMTLDYLGVAASAAILDGGIVAWKAAGFPVSTDAPPARRGSLTIRPEPQRVVEADWVAERVDDAGTVLVDARPLDEYTGDDGGMDGRLLPGHIPGARHLYWEELMVSRDDPRLLPEPELRARFEAAGASTDRTVVVYCYIGMRASMAYFVSRMLGYETRLYDGSWHDWSARGLPHATGPDRGIID